MNKERKNKNKLVTFPSNPKSSLKMKEDGKGCWSIQQLPGQPEVRHEIDIELDEEIMKKYNVSYKNLIGKVISVLSRTSEGKNYYADKTLKIIIRIIKEKNNLKVDEIKPLHFYNEDGFKVEVINDSIFDD